MKRPLQAIVFDFDGTLAELNIDFSQMRKAVLDLIAGYPVPLDGLAQMFVLEMIDAGKALIAQQEPGQEDAFHRKALALISGMEMAAAKKGRLIEGTREMLAVLKTRRIRIGVITRNCQEAVLAIFPDILDYCDVVLPREMTRHVKPHPEHLRIMLERLGVFPAQAAMVGDHPMDILVGKQAGAFTIGVLTGHTPSYALQGAGADLILDRATDITHLLPS